MISKLQEFVKEANDISEDWQAERWREKVGTFLSELKGYSVRKQFDDLCFTQNIFDNMSRQLGFLEAMLVKEQNAAVTERKSNIESPSTQSNKRIFVVHGHDNEAKESLCRFIEKIGLDPIVLHEQANEGLTIVEKFEKHSDVIFAVVLLTPDDKGASKDNLDSLSFRARQNVVLELGYFLGALGRHRVCALYKGDVEIPSDYQGVLYIPMDDAGAWKNKVAQEFVRGHIEIDLSGLL